MNARTGARMRRRIRGTWHEGDEKSNESERQSRVGEEIIDARADFLQIRDSSLEPRVIPYRGSPITKHRAEDFARRSRATGLSGSDVAARVRWRSTRPTRSPDVKDEGTAPKKVVKSHKMGMKATPSPYMMKVKLFHEKKRPRTEVRGHSKPSKYSTLAESRKDAVVPLDGVTLPKGLLQDMSKIRST